MTKERESPKYKTKERRVTHNVPCSDLQILFERVDTHINSGNTWKADITKNVKEGFEEIGKQIQDINKFRWTLIGKIIGINAVIAILASAAVSALTLIIMWRSIPHG